MPDGNLNKRIGWVGAGRMGLALVDPAARRRL